VTRIGRPAGKRVFVPRFRVACLQARQQETQCDCRKNPLKIDPEHHASLLRHAERRLVAKVEHMARKFSLPQATAEIATDIKATMNAPLPPYNFTVMQTLCERYRADAFNDSAAETFPDIRGVFDNAIQKFATARGSSARKAQRLIDNAWKWDHAADRRMREGSAAPHKGRPEVYDRDVVWAFADTIARVAKRERFATGHHGDMTITEKDDKGGPMLRVLLASIQWAMIAAWQGAAPPGTAPPIVKPEGILTILKRGRLTNRTD
jgi:hypothetical protein